MSDFQTVMAAYREMKDVTIPAEDDIIQAGLRALQLGNERRRREIHSRRNDSGSGSGSSSDNATMNSSARSSSPPSGMPFSDMSNNESGDDDDRAVALTKRPRSGTTTKTQGAHTIFPSGGGRHPFNHSNKDRLATGKSGTETDPEGEAQPERPQRPKPKSTAKASQAAKQPTKKPRAPVPIQPVVPAKRTIAEAEGAQDRTKKSKTSWQGVLASLWAKTAAGDVPFANWGQETQKGVTEALCNTSIEEAEIARVVRLGMEGEGKGKQRKPTRSGACLMAAAISRRKIGSKEVKAASKACSICRNPNIAGRPCLTARPGGGFLLMPLEDNETDVDVLAHWVS